MKGRRVVMAFYFSMLLVGALVPGLVGPFETWEECASVREWVDHLGHDTATCGVMPFPQEAQVLHVFDLPKEE